MNANKERLYKDVEFLTALRPYRNFENRSSLEKVCTYISKEFENLKLVYEEQKWIANGKEYTNIIASYNIHKSKRLIIGAHYDVCGNQPGADDNASAVAGLLESARLIVKNAPSLDYRIDFVAYCLEEPPFFASNEMGSYIHAKSLHENNVDVIGMICYEMIGYFSDEPNSQPYPSPAFAKIYPSVGNFIFVVGVQEYATFNNKIYNLMCENKNIDTHIINFETKEDLAGLSDQRNYWKFGYNALMINDTSFLRNPNYHQVTDTIETLNFNKMTEVINSTYNAMINL